MSLAPEDDERTIVRPSPGKGGPHAAGVQLGHTLPIGTRVRDYEITGLIGEGGFGIVYLAYDHSLERHVAIKEYMPSSMASRVTGSATIVVKSERHQETFKAGLKSFVNEARLLARFDHPALVKVYRFWEENGTAYMVMPYYEGPTLKSALAARAQVPDEAALRAWLRPLLDALGVMHAAQCYHRDIAPDNILLTPAGPLLLDFGAARRVIGDMTHALTVVLKPGYAPIEQYGDVATMTQGAWTDLYALACVVYFAITGKVPMSSVERLMDDRLVPLSQMAAGRYSDRFLRAIDAALAVRPHDRPQTDAQFRALLEEPAATPVVPAAAVAPPAPAFRAAPAPDDVPTRILPAPRTAAPGPLPRTEPPATTRQPEPAPVPAALERHSNRPAALPTAPGAWPSEAARLDRGVSAFHAQPFRASEAPGETREAAPAPIAAVAPRASSRMPIYVAGAAICAIAATAAGLHFFGQRPATEPQASGSTSAVPVTTPASATPAVAAAPVPTAPAPVLAPPVVVEAPTTVSAPAASPDASSLPAGPPRSEATAPRPETPATPTEATATPARERPNESSTPPRAKREAPAHEPTARVESVPRPEQARPTPTHGGGVQAHCSDILQKASLEPLTGEEAEFLKRECR